MKKLKRLLAILLATVLVISVLSVGFTANAATTLTEEQFAKKISALKSEYPHGKYWNNHNGIDSDGNSKAGSNKGTCGGNTCSASCSCSCGCFKNVGYQCFGFANLMAAKVFGSYATKTMQTTGGVNTSKGWKRIEYSDKTKYTYYAGDFVEVKNYGHSIFIIKISGNYVYYVDCNWTGPCQINWNGKKTLGEMRTWTSYIVRMSGNTLTGSGTTNYTLSVRYNSNGAVLDCKNYIVSTGVGLVLRSSYSTSTSQLAVIPDDTQITISETKSSGGYTWGKTTYDSKTGWCALSKGSDVYAYKRYYLNSNNVYTTVDQKIFSQSWEKGTTKSGGLYNYTTFGMKKDGYSFVGWCAKSDGSSTVFGQDDATLKAEDIFSDVNTQNCSITLYAIWRQNTKTIKSVSVLSNPNKKTYFLGDIFDPTGLSLKVEYTDDSTAIVTQGYTLEYNFSNAGVYNVDIEYGGYISSVEVEVEEPYIYLSEHYCTLEVNEEKSISATISPTTDYVYASSDENVVVVDSAGRIRGVSNGTATISASFEYNGFYYYDDCGVIVGAESEEIQHTLEAANGFIENKTAKSGDTVSLSLRLENAPKLKSIAISDIFYDNSVLEFIGGAWKCGDCILSSIDVKKRTAVIAFGENTDCNSEIFELLFRVATDSEAGNYEISCNLTAKYKDEGTEKAVEIYAVPGSIDVIGGQRGDVNDDGEVNSDDAIHLLYYTLLPDLYPVNQNVDFDGNGSIDSDDSIYLLYYTLLPDLYPLH